MRKLRVLAQSFVDPIDVTTEDDYWVHYKASKRRFYVQGIRVPRFVYRFVVWRISRGR